MIITFTIKKRRKHSRDDYWNSSFSLPSKLCEHSCLSQNLAKAFHQVIATLGIDISIYCGASWKIKILAQISDELEFSDSLGGNEEEEF